MRRILLPLLALPLLAQAPAKGSKAFFLQDPKAVMAACVEESMAQAPNRDHGATQAEWGRALLAAGQRSPAEDLFDRAAVLGGHGSGGGLVDLFFGGISPPSSSMLQLVGSTWLRNGYVNEALASFESMSRLNPEDEDGFLKAGKDLLRAGLARESAAMMQAYRHLQPRRASDFLEFAEVAAAHGHRELTQHWCQAAVEANPKDALDIARAGRLLSEALRVPSPTLAPWAPSLQAGTPPVSGKVWVVPTFEITLAKEGSNIPSASQTFSSLYPDRKTFTQAALKRILTSLAGSELLPGNDSAATFPAKARDGQLPLGARDAVIGITAFEIRDEQTGYSPHTRYFRSARLRLALFDAQGKLRASHGFVTILPGVFKMEKGLEATFGQMADFLAGPTFARWRE